MKRKLLSLVCFLLTLGWSVESNAQPYSVGDVFEYSGHRYKVTGENLITNGSFEDGLTGWTNAAGGAMTEEYFALETDNPQNGTYCLHPLEHDGGASAKSIGTAWAIETGTTYLFSYYLRTTNPNAGYIKSSLTNTPRGDELAAVYNFPTGYTADGETWYQAQTVFTNDSYEYYQVKFRWLRDEKDWYFDNFYLASVVELPNDDELNALRAKIAEAQGGLANLTEGTKSHTELSNTINEANELLTSGDANAVNEMSGTLDIVTRNAGAELYDATAENPKSVTSLLQNPDCSSGESGWTKSGVGGTNSEQHWSGKTNTYLEPCSWGSEGWTGSFSQTLTNLPSGVYKLTAAGRASVYATLSLVVNGQSVDYPSLEDVGGTIATDGTEWESVEAGIAAGKSFANGNLGRGWTYRSITFKIEDGTVTLGCTSKSDEKYQWASIDDFELYYYGTPEWDYTALDELADELDLVTDFGFEVGQYAPYNCTLFRQEIDKVRDGAYITQDEVDAAIQGIGTIEGIANTEEVNAVYNGDFAKCEPDGPMPGWQMSNNTLGGALHSRALFDNRLAEFNETMSAAFLRFDGVNSNRGSLYTYGEVEGYTMPLKANTVYCLSVDVKGWGYVGYPIRLNLNGPAGFPAWYSDIVTESRADTDDNAPQHFHYVFNTGEYAGNYKIWFQVPGLDTNKHNVVVSNISLWKAENITVNIAAGKYATRIFPFAPDFGGADVTVYSCSGVDDSGKLNLTEVTTPEANIPYILYSETGCDITVSDYNDAVGTEKTDGCLTGVLSSEGKEITSGYVLQTLDSVQAFYAVSEEDPITVPQYRVYLTLPAEAGVNALRLVLPGDDDATAISEVAAESATVDVYSISGVFVRKGVKASEALNGLQKGIYVVNGVKKAVK